MSKRKIYTVKNESAVSITWTVDKTSVAVNMNSEIGILNSALPFAIKNICMVKAKTPARPNASEITRPAK